MPQLVVTCRPDGSVETLLKDKVLDTRMFGDRKIERLSEVLPTDDGQKFYIRWLKGPLATDWTFLGGEQRFYSNRSIHCHDDGETVYFDSYEAAVECEVSTVNALRLQGHTFT